MTEIKEAKRVAKPAEAKKEEAKKEDPNVIAELQRQLKENQEAMAKMQEMMAKMQSQPAVSELKEVQPVGRNKVKVMSLLPYQLNLTTEPMGMGKVYTFNKYGEAQKIRFNDLEDIVHNHRKNMEDGVFYICDRDAIEALELTDEYESLFDKIGVDKIVELADETSVEMFLTLSDFMRDAVARQIAEKINSGANYNLNYLNTIQMRSDIDIMKIAQELKTE